ncbi:Phosphoribulokinase/uridine kinase, partial [Cynara cardunculus var. scolymus]
MDAKLPAKSKNSVEDQSSHQPNGVAGGTASGKTTVCNVIISRLRDQRVVLINQDSFYHSLSDEQSANAHDYNFDHPETYTILCDDSFSDSFNTELLLSCMETLKKGQPVNIPAYDYKIHKSTGSGRMVSQVDVIILEGILVLHDHRVRDLMNMKIFVDSDSDVRLGRRIKRDTVERGRNIQYVLDQYDKHVKPSFEEFILPSKKYADVIIPRGSDNDVAIDLIVQHIRTKLGQHDLCKIYQNLFVIPSTFQIRGMHTLIRDVKTRKHDFVFYADRLIRLDPSTQEWCSAKGCVESRGESMENALRACCKGIKIGKVLIQREGNGRQAPEGIHAVCRQYPRLKIVTSEIDSGLNEHSRVIPGMGEFGDRYFGTGGNGSMPFLPNNK